MATLTRFRVCAPGGTPLVVAYGGQAYRSGDEFTADARDRRVARWIRNGMIAPAADEPTPDVPKRPRKRTASRKGGKR